MSPQHSNKAALLDGALRCLERLPPDQVTARAIATESGANLASISYHFGSKDNLVTEAAILGLDRWLVEIGRRLDAVAATDPAERFRLAHQVVDETRDEHLGLARNYVVAMARGQHDERLRETLAAGFHRSRRDLAVVLGLGTDRAGTDCAGLVLAMFHGLLIQVLLDPGLGVDGVRMLEAQARLGSILSG